MKRCKPRGNGSSDGRWRRSVLRVRGLKAQILLWTVLPLTLVLIGVAFTGVYSHEQAMRVLVQERDRALATVSAAQVRDLLRARVGALESLEAEPPFHHQDTPGQRAALALAGNLGGLFRDDVAFVDDAGAPIATAADTPPWIQVGGLPDLVRAVMVRQDVALTQPFDALWGDGVLLLGVPVYDEMGSVYGVLAGPVALDSLDLDLLLSQVQVGEHGVVYLVDAAGQILARSPAARARKSLAGHTGLDIALADDGAGATLCRAPSGERMTLAYAPVGLAGAGWRVLIEQPWREVVGPVLRYSQFMPLVAALAAIVSLLALYYGVRAIVRPLQVLGEKAERVAWGDFEATSAPVGGVEEIEDLRRTLDQMARRIQGYQRGMHGYIAAITQGQEEERRRLARELHDDTAQSLIALGQQVEMAQRLLATDPGRAEERLATVRLMLAETVEGVRRFSRGLRPIYLEDLGFIPALEMLTRPESSDFRTLRQTMGTPDADGPAIHFSTSGVVRRLPSDLELAAYRIVQEALNNAIQHGRASNIWVAVHFEEQHLLLSVRDDGQGFQAPDLPDTLAHQGHFGLMGIQERALLYGGQLTVRSAPGEGAEVSVQLPYPS